MPVEKSCSELHTRHSRAAGSGIRLAARRASPRTNRRIRRLCFERQCFWLASKLSAVRRASRELLRWLRAAAAVPSWLGLLDCTHRVDSRSWATLSRCASCCCCLVSRCPARGAAVSRCFSGLVSSSPCVWWSARLLRLPSGGTEPLQQSAIHCTVCKFCSKMSYFAMGTILGKGFAQAQVHTNHSTIAEGTSSVMYVFLRTL